MRALLENFWRRGRGFTTADLLDAIRPWFGGVDDFYHRYVQGRDPLPYDSILPGAGIAVERREQRIPMVGVGTAKLADGGAVVSEVVPGSLADAVGLEPGDVLLKVGEVPTGDPAWPLQFQSRYAGADGRAIAVTYRRGGRLVTRSGPVRVRVARSIALRPDPAATAEARAILEAITGARP